MGKTLWYIEDAQGVKPIQKSKKRAAEVKEIETIRDEFRGVLILLLDLLQHGEAERAINAILQILGK